MNLPEIPLLSMLKERMGWLNQRQNLLSQNVANVDTPGYTARDLKPVDFEQVLRTAASSTNFSSSIMTTNPRHITLSHGASTFDAQDTPDIASNPSGNSVSLEQEMIKVADTQAQFQAATNLYAKAIGMMKTAIGR